MITVNPNYQLSNSQLIQNRFKLINEWKPQREVWSLKYGDIIIAGMACINGAIINSMFRQSLKLRHHGWKFTMLFVSTGPAIAAYSCHKSFITDHLILQRPKCMACQELKSSAMLEGNALLYSLIVAPSINLAIAGSIGYRIPHIYEVKELLKFWWNVVRPKARIISFIFLCNMVVSSTVTYSQITSMEKITSIVLKIHKYLENRKDTGMDPKPSNTNSLL
ncbi:transmembrane protein 126 [Bombus fervidus]|uniref:transmembrane protein 126 n=1 Tax=Bombus fervidus TaxID=203811 RepID=UPI003AB32F5B